jgi:hypothetical protein
MKSNMENNHWMNLQLPEWSESKFQSSIHPVYILWYASSRNLMTENTFATTKWIQIMSEYFINTLLREKAVPAALLRVGVQHNVICFTIRKYKWDCVNKVTGRQDAHWRPVSHYLMNVLTSFLLLDENVAKKYSLVKSLTLDFG